MKKKRKKERKGILKSKYTLIYLQENIKWNNFHIIGVPEGEEREKEPEKFFKETVPENVPNLSKKRDIKVQEAQRLQ